MPTPKQFATIRDLARRLQDIEGQIARAAESGFSSSSTGNLGTASEALEGELATTKALLAEAAESAGVPLAEATTEIGLTTATATAGSGVLGTIGGWFGLTGTAATVGGMVAVGAVLIGGTIGIATLAGSHSGAAPVVAGPRGAPTAAQIAAPAPEPVDTTSTALINCRQYCMDHTGDNPASYLPCANHIPDSMNATEATCDAAFHTATVNHQNVQP
jgi:hypothetical protein